MVDTVTEAGDPGASFTRREVDSLEIGEDVVARRVLLRRDTGEEVQVSTLVFRGLVEAQHPGTVILRQGEDVSASLPTGEYIDTELIDTRPEPKDGDEVEVATADDDELDAKYKTGSFACRFVFLTPSRVEIES